MTLKLFFAKYALYFKIIGGIVAGVPTVYGVNSWLEKHYNNQLITQQSTTNDKQELKRIAVKLDTMLYVQKIQLDNQSILSSQISTANDKLDVFGPILKKHVSESAKNKDEILQTVKDFGPYWNYNNEKKKLNLMDTIKYNLLSQLKPK